MKQSTTAQIAGREWLVITRWEDPIVDALGFDSRSEYAERYWLPIIGPSALWTARALARLLDGDGSDVAIPMEQLARQIGLGSGNGRNAPIVRTLGRLVDFGLAMVNRDGYAIRLRFAPLTRAQVGHLPPYLAELHRREVS